jgi:curved DNA-binding protein CbpA
MTPAMQDAFAILQLARRPWLEEAEVRAAFQKAAARMHPDAASGSAADFSELTKAYQTLREPASRLRHLIALECPGAASTAQLPTESMTLFPIIAAVRQKLESARSPADLASGRTEAKAADKPLQDAMDLALAEVRKADESWPSEVARQALPALQARLAFLEKWQAQLREALLRLDIGGV